jgi:hypothetical protein
MKGHTYSGLAAPNRLARVSAAYCRLCRRDTTWLGKLIIGRPER